MIKKEIKSNIECVHVTSSLGVGGGVLPIMAYTGRLHPKGVPFSGFRYIEEKGFHKLKYIKGKLVFLVLKGPLIIMFRIDTPNGFISLFIKHCMKMSTRLCKVVM